MKVLITGMTGFVGAALTKELFNTDIELIGLVRSKNNVPDEVLDKYRVVVADISKKVPQIDCDLVVHTAATVSEKVLAVIMNKTNVEGTRRVLEATGDAKFIYISSGSVYNLTEQAHKEDEDVRIKLLTSYGRSKYKSENIIREEFKDRDALILRPRAIYGKGDRVILPRLFKIYKNGVIKVPGDLQQLASMTNIEFFAQVIHRFIKTDFRGHEIYNVSDFQDYNLGDNLTNLFGSIFNREISINSMNETLIRVIAGMREILVPGNQFTQTSIDYLTRDHTLDTTKLQARFPDLRSPDFNEYLPTYVKWINDIGIQNIIKKDNNRIVWT